MQWVSQLSLHSPHQPSEFLYSSPQSFFKPPILASSNKRLEHIE